MAEELSLFKPTEAMTENEFVPRPYAIQQENESTTWRAPSNIALVKYWGKKEKQLPANPSLSFTLKTSVTTTRLTYKRREIPDDTFSFEVMLDKEPKEDFRPKIRTFFDRAFPYLPFLKDFHFTIETTNSFPHSSGIASSASGLAALALCLTDLEKQWVPDMNEVFFKRKASFLARLGSGSAGRSIQGPLMQWGKHPDIEGSSDLYAIPYPLKVHDIFQGYRDTILLVDRGRKPVSSTLGHDLMKGHPFASARYTQAMDHLNAVEGVLASGDLDEFAAIVEQEALSLHAMMMTSRPYFILMRPHTLNIIQRVWAYRESSGLPLCFTLDAGANVHLLYPEDVREAVEAFIKESLVEYCEKGQYICDQIGFGAKKM